MDAKGLQYMDHH